MSMGITFNVYGHEAGTEKVWPFDLIPRVIEQQEWNYVADGLRQRIHALNLFIDDMYHDQKIVRDGEGVTRFVTVRVEGGRSEDECRLAAYAIAHSPLVKTAFFASDPNLGRILAAVGYAGIADLDQTRIDLHLDDVHVATGGGRHPQYREEDGQRVMKQAEITVRVGLGRGTAHDTVWTCDLSHDYVSINADYRS